MSDDSDDSDDEMLVGSITQSHLNTEHLKEHGFVVLRCPWMNKQKRESIRLVLKNTLRQMPEFKPRTTQQMHEPWVMGGFSALGNPSSFHNPFVRRMRAYAMYEVIPLMRQMRPNNSYKLEQIVDRLMVRPKGAAPSAESWHRDEAALAAADDLLFGGWWNFDEDDQFFSCVPKTHKGVSKNAGYALIKDKAVKLAYKKKSIKVRIPPGCIIVFYERIVHEVIGKKAAHEMLRLFLGWRLTKSTEPLYPNEIKFKTQAVMPLKSNQTPSMFATLHWINWRVKIEEFAKFMKEECRESRRVLTGKCKGDTHAIVHEHMRSLEEYGLPLYHKYQKREINMHRPNSTFVVLNGADDKVRRISF